MSHKVHRTDLRVLNAGQGLMGTADLGISKHLPLAELQELQRPGPGGHLALAAGDFQGPSSPGLGLCSLSLGWQV